MTVIPQMIENQIALMKKCLEFYSDENNWNKKGDKSLIENDGGFLAKETLKNVEKLEQQNKEISDQFDELSKLNSNPEALMNEIQNLINKQND